MKKDSQPTPQPRKSRPLLRGIGAAFWSLILCMFILSIGLMLVVKDRTIQLSPDLQTKLAQALNSDDDAIDIQFDSAFVAFGPSWHPVVGLRDIAVIREDGGVVATAAQANVKIALQSLIERRLIVPRVELSGARAQVERKTDGRFDFGLPDSGATTTLPNAQEIAALLPKFAEEMSEIGLQTMSFNEITLDYIDRISGKAWTFDGGQIGVSQTEAALDLRLDLALLTGTGDLATMAVSVSKPTGVDARISAEFEGIAARDLASQIKPLYWMTLLEAPLSGSLQLPLTDAGFGELNAVLNLGAGAFLATDGAEPIAFETAKTYFEFDPTAQRLDLSLFEFTTKFGRVAATGSALLQQTAVSGPPSQMVVQLALEDSDLDVSPLMVEPIRLRGVQLDAQVNFAPFHVTLGQVAGQVNGIGLQATGQTFEQDGDLKSQYDIHVARADVHDILSVWPPSVKSKSRQWFVDNVATAHLARATVGVSAQNDATQVSASFAFDRADIRFMKHMPLMTDVMGYGTLIDNQLSLAVERGRVEAPQGGIVDTSGSYMSVEDVTQRPATGQFAIQGSGPMTAVLSLLDQKPLNVMEKANLPVALGAGQVEFTANVTSPLKKGNKPDDIEYAVAATISDFSSQKLVKGRALEAGLVQITASRDLIDMSANARLDGIAAVARWSMTPGSGQSVLDADIQISPQNLAGLGIALPDGMLEGASPAQLEVVMRKGQKPDFKVTSNLRGVRLSVPQIGWTKPKTRDGALTVAGKLGAVPTVDVFKLSGSGLQTSGSIVLNADSSLRELRLPVVKVGNWLDGGVVLTGRGKGNPLGVEVTKGVVNLTTAPFKGTPTDAQTAPMRLRLSSFRVSDGISLRDFTANLTGGQGLNGTFSGRVNGGTLVEGRFARKEDKPVIIITSENAGGALRDAGVFKQANSGDLILELTPNAGGFDGTLAVKGARVKDAPVMANLLSAVSVVGIFEQLDGKGLIFNEIDADFRLEGDLFILRRVSAIGPSLGLSLDGYINTGENTLDLQGVLSPFYVLNGLGSFLTRKGEGLIGFNFNLSGPTAKPKVAVNPLSVFTPGMFREIFRRAPPK